MSFIVLFPSKCLKNTKETKRSMGPCNEKTIGSTGVVVERLRIKCGSLERAKPLTTGLVDVPRGCLGSGHGGFQQGGSCIRVLVQESGCPTVTSNESVKK